MRLSRVYIPRYGPLQKDLELDGEINVIRGPNESGKSLLVEGLLKQLADGSVPNSVIDESPEGFVELSDGGERHKLDDGQSLLAFCRERYGQEIRSEELRNVFVIRSGDLTFHEGDNFYTHITDKLTGRSVEDIDKIKSTLVEEGRLTPRRLNVSSDSSYHDAGDQLDDARALKADIEDYIERTRDEGLERAETELFAAKRKEADLEEKIEKLEKAKEKEEKQERYEELSTDKDTIEENLEKLDDLPESSDLEELDEQLQELQEKEAQQPELKERKDRSFTLAKWSIGASVVTFGLVLAFGFPAVGVFTTVLFLGAAGYFWYRTNQIGDEIAELSVQEEDVVADARAAGLSVDTREEIREIIPGLKEQRDEFESENKGKKAVLQREFGFGAESMEDAVNKAEQELEALERNIDDSFETEFDAQELEEARRNYEEATKKRESLEEDLENHQQKLQKFRQRAYGLNFSIFVEEQLDLEVENLDALEKLVERLDEFIAAIEDDAEASRVAIEIFDEIQEEEREETAELFEEGSRATEIFQEITDGRYETVTYDNEANQLVVVKSTGEQFGPEQLSDGTRDQLYLSIRVALGEEILDDEAGFFIMDDAFLTADPQRLETQADVVEKLADDGWQIVYLSSKEDAIKVLSSRSENGVEELPALE